MPDGRAGRFVQQPWGYRAFVPAPLPPEPPLAFDAQLQKLLSDADQAIGRLDGYAGLLPNPDLFVAMYVRREAVSRIHRTKLDEAGCRAAGEFDGCVGVRRAAPGAGRSQESVAQRRSGALRVRARGCARRARACWRELRLRFGAVSGRQVGSGIARSRASAAASCPAQGQRFGRCRVHRRAEWVSRPAREK